MIAVVDIRRKRKARSSGGRDNSRIPVNMNHFIDSSID